MLTTGTTVVENPGFDLDAHGKVFADMTGSQERSALLRQHRAGSIGQLRVAVLSTFPPRQCGLATFAFDLAVSLRASGVAEVQVVAVNRTIDSSEIGRAHV